MSDLVLLISGYEYTSSTLGVGRGATPGLVNAQLCRNAGNWEAIARKGAETPYKKKKKE